MMPGWSKLGLSTDAALATGAGHHVDVDAFRDVLGGRCRTLARLVVRVSVHVHQSQLFSHVSFCTAMCVRVTSSVPWWTRNLRPATPNHRCWCFRLR